VKINSGGKIEAPGGAFFLREGAVVEIGIFDEGQA
jgi:hypothetical protein